MIATFGFASGVIKRVGGITESLLIITGSMGSGKTSVLDEASDLLARRHITHAAIDLDTLGLAHLDSGDTNALMYRNLECVCKNYAAFGVRRLLLARAIENRVELELCCSIVSAKSTAVCRLTASDETMEQRVNMRDSGIARRDYIARVAELNNILDHAQLEDFTVSSENRSVTEIAREVLAKAGWIPGESA